MLGFRAKLAKRQSEVKTLVCVGLDPLEEKIPACIPGVSTSKRTEFWMEDIVKATAPFASMYKPQSAHWEAIPGGFYALAKTIRYIHSYWPDIPVFLDCKRGDIARTQQQYRRAHFDIQGADGMNFSPYMGKDCMSALVDKDAPGRALVGLCYTSNPDARQVQDAVMVDGMSSWERYAEWILQWAEELGVVEDAGLVMAAAYEKPKKSGNVYSDHLTRCRRIVGDKLWFLIPGVGAQGGFIAETVRTAYAGPGSIAINSSSEIDFASSGKDFAEAAAQKAEELRDKINAAL
ncbi:MAG: orotidine-5'-phosphate decarboxylase [Candidatus Staskawiczbacteria bacterium]|nr:orotidine-5'-phosphate decarboxylase [Candidatus Staskawiczbacteria bacterium]